MSMDRCHILSMLVIAKKIVKASKIRKCFTCALTKDYRFNKYGQSMAEILLNISQWLSESSLTKSLLIILQKKLYYLHWQQLNKPIYVCSIQVIKVLPAYLGQHCHQMARRTCDDGRALITRHGPRPQPLDYSFTPGRFLCTGIPTQYLGSLIFST